MHALLNARQQMYPLMHGGAYMHGTCVRMRWCAVRETRERTIRARHMPSVHGT